MPLQVDSKCQLATVTEYYGPRPPLCLLIDFGDQEISLSWFCNHGNNTTDLLEA